MQVQIAPPNESCKGFVLYSDMSEEEADKYPRYAGLLLPQSRDAFETTVTYTIGDPVIPVYYIVCEQEGRTVPPAGQKMAVGAIKGFKVLRIQC